ncbi:MAG: GDSL-type esterase/lipase family protein [Parcubacteria group bacterium]|jgi:lysophospholipase L1-like esterase
MEKTINIFGDSIVWGACDEMGGWANRLRNYLSEDQVNYLKVYNLGVSGDNTEKLLERFSFENETRNPDTIIIAIGINDSQYINSKDNPRVKLEKFENNLLELIAQAKKFTEEIIFVGITKVDENKVMPIKWDATKFYDNENIAKYNAKIKEVSVKNKLLFVEMTDLLGENDLEDGLRPNSTGHEKIFLRVKDYLSKNKII